MARTSYRPGSAPPTEQCCAEFSSVPENLVTRNSQLLILGDFNIFVEVSTLPTISFPFDLAITCDDDQVDDQVLPLTISDHSFIQFSLPSIVNLFLHSDASWIEILSVLPSVTPTSPRLVMLLMF